MFKLGFVKPPLILSSLTMGLKNPVVSPLPPFEPLYFWKGTLKVLLPTEDPPTDNKQTRATKVTQRRNARIAEHEENESLWHEVNVKSAKIKKLGSTNNAKRVQFYPLLFTLSPIRGEIMAAQE